MQLLVSFEEREICSLLMLLSYLQLLIFLQLPPRIRTFLWRAGNDILPVGCALTRRHLGGDPNCPLCYTSSESTAYSFFECSGFVRTWEAEPFNIIIPRRHTNFPEWLRFLRSGIDTEVFLLACVVCWRIWWFRNRIVHERWREQVSIS